MINKNNGAYIPSVKFKSETIVFNLLFRIETDLICFRDDVVKKLKIKMLGTFIKKYFKL